MSVIAQTSDWTPTHARIEGFVTYGDEEVFAVATYKYDSDDPTLGEIYIYES